MQNKATYEGEWTLKNHETVKTLCSPLLCIVVELPVVSVGYVYIVLKTNVYINCLLKHDIEQKYYVAKCKIC